MTGKRIGYIRVSTSDQNPDRQLSDIPLEKKFIDYASASSMDRPNLQLMLEFIREDDIVFVHSMDRLARNVSDLRKIVNIVVQKGAVIHFSKEKLIFDSCANPISNLLLSVMGALAEFELSFIRERQKEGIAAAKAKGKFKGGKKKLNHDGVRYLKELMDSRESKLRIAQKLKISMPTLYKYLRDLGLESEIGPARFKNG